VITVKQNVNKVKLWILWKNCKIN